MICRFSVAILCRGIPCKLSSGLGGGALRGGLEKRLERLMRGAGMVGSSSD